MVSDIKPTTLEERARWKQRLQKLLMDMPEAAASARTDREFTLRLIADYDRLEAALRDAERALEHFEHGAPRPNENAKD